MGCSNSKVDSEEGVARCKQRKKLMQQAVTSRNNYAAAHAQFLESLKGIGSAFRQFAEGEVKEGEHHQSMYPDTPTTPRTPTLSLGPPPPPMSPVYSPSPPRSPPTTKMSALRLQRGAVSSPESVSMDFLPPPPPPVNVKQQFRMEHTPPVIPTKIFRFDDSSNSSYMAKPYRMEDSAPPPLIQPVQIDDDWRYSGQSSTTPPLSRESNPPPPPPVTRSSWQDLFMDPFRPSPPTYNYMEQKRNQEGDEQERKLQEAEQKRKHDEEQRRIHEMEQRKAHEMEQRKAYEMEQRKAHEMEQRKAYEMEQRKAHELEQRRAQDMEQRTPPKQAREKSPDRPPPVKTQQQESELDIPELEDIEDVPDLEDVDEDVDAPPSKESDDKKDTKKKAKQPEPEPQTPPKTPPKTPTKTPQNAHEKPPKAAKTPTPGKPPKPEQREEAMARVNKELSVVKAEKGGRDLLDVLKEVDDCYMKAAESGENVSRMLETKKAHYHSSFSVLGESGRMQFWKKSGKSGSPGATNHHRTGSNMSVVAEESASIMSMRDTRNMSMRNDTRNVSMRNLSSMSSQRWSEECGLTGSHASTLDRLFVWEKKLYLEVKGAEALRVDLERKYALFRNQDAKNEDQTVIDKTRCTIKDLQTRMVVAIEAVDSAATQVQKLRDEELYPQLLELLEGIGTMWREMSLCHQAQLRAVEAIRRLDNSAACEPTTSSHRHSTQQLENGLNKWSDSLSRAVQSQRDYLKSLTLWLRLSLMQFGDEAPDTRAGSRSPSRSPRTPLSNTASSPIYGLCSKWLDSLDQLADRVVLEAIGSFAAVVREMLRLQWEELRIKKRVETYQRELEKREHALASAAMRDPGSVPHMMPQTPSTTSGSDMDDRSYDSRYDGRYEGRYDVVPHRDMYSERTEVADKRNKMEASRRKLENEIQAERKAYTDTRAYTLNSLQAGLPQLFQAILSFCNQETDVYEKLSGAGTPLRGRH